MNGKKKNLYYLEDVLYVTVDWLFIFSVRDKNVDYLKPFYVTRYTRM